MEETCKVKILALVKDHFSKATDSDGLIVWDDVKGYGYDDARRAIEDHRREKGSMAYRPDPRRVRALAATYHRERVRKASARVRVIDWIRREDDHRATLHDLADAEAIVAKYRMAYDNLVASECDPIGFGIARAYIRSHAAAALREIGVPDADVIRDSGFCAGLEPGERLPRLVCERGGTAKPFQSDEPPPPSQQPYQALRALAEQGYDLADPFLEHAPV